MGKVNNIQCKQSGNSKHQKEMPQNKNIVTEMKNVFNESTNPRKELVKSIETC